MKELSSETLEAALKSIRKSTNKGPKHGWLNGHFIEFTDDKSGDINGAQNREMDR